MKTFIFKLLAVFVTFLFVVYACKKDEKTTPTITTVSVTEIAATSARSGGNITSDGAAQVTARGLVFSTSQMPTLEQNIGFTSEGNGTGSFESLMKALLPNTDYFVRAFASNSQGTAYGAQVTFTTLPLPVVIAELITEGVSEITQTTATSGGNVINDGGANITAWGVVWSLSQLPTIDNYQGITSDGAGTGGFTSHLSGLAPDTTYYLRAYATNSAGTAYGNQIAFKTLSASAPVANFTANPTIGVASLQVNFTDQSTNNPTSWQWEFGDGNTSTLQNPQHNYQNDGKYTVQLTVTNNYGSDIETKSNYIIVTTGDGTGQPCPGTPTVTDIDGNIYNTVVIGEQCWMKENLKVTRNATGDSIFRLCYGYNIPAFCNLYGGLYSWTCLMNGAASSNSNPSGVQGICPVGWHVPSDAEWTQLVDYVVAQGFPNSNVINGVGNALKSCRQINSPLGVDCITSEHPRWNYHSSNHGFDEFGFSVFPGGYARGNYLYDLLGISGYIWSSTETEIWYGRSVGFGDGRVNRSKHDKWWYISVRCLRD